MLTTTPLLIGAPLGLVAGAAVFRAFANRIGAFPDPAFPFVLVVSMMIRLIVVANLVAVMPTRHADPACAMTLRGAALASRLTRRPHGSPVRASR